MMMTSPPNENGDRAIYFMLRPEPITIGDPDRPDIKTWLEQHTEEAASQFGRMTQYKALKSHFLPIFYKFVFGGN